MIRYYIIIALTLYFQIVLPSQDFYKIPVSGGFHNTDFRSIEKHFALVHQQYFQEKNKYEDLVHATVLHQKVVVQGLDAMSGYFSDQRDYITLIRCCSRSALDRYIRYQLYCFPEHIRAVVAELPSKVEGKFVQTLSYDIEHETRTINLLAVSQNQNTENQIETRKGFFLETAAYSLSFGLFTKKIMDRQFNIVAGIIGALYLRFLWNQYRNFSDQADIFQKREIELKDQLQAAIDKKKQLESYKSLIPGISEELIRFTNDQIEILDRKLQQYQTAQLQKIREEIEQELANIEQRRQHVLDLEQYEIKKLMKSFQQTKPNASRPEKQIPTDSKSNILITMFGAVSSFFKS